MKMKKRNKLQWLAFMLVAALMMTVATPTISARAEDEIALANPDLIDDEPHEICGGGGNTASTESTGINILFGQKSISANFSTKGTFNGASVESVAEQIASGTISANSLPIEYVVRNGTAIALNNRSLAALSLADTKPTVLINTTGNAINEAKVTARLSEMGGAPSESISIRNTGRTVNIVKH